MLQLPADDSDVCEHAHIQECLFYLHTYGVHSQLVSFYQRQRLYIKALGLIHSQVGGVTSGFILNSVQIFPYDYAVT